jgi:hypothetical protein
MAVATALAIGALAVGAYGAYQTSRAQGEQAQTASNVAEFNAKVKEQEAIEADMEARANLANARRRGGRLISQMRGQVAASGVLLEGSPLEIIAENAAQLETNALIADREGRKVSRRALADAQSIRMGGTAQAAGFRSQQQATILGGTANLLGSGFQFQRSGAIG